MFEPDKAALMVVDVQEKLFRLMPEKELLAKHMRQMIQGSKALGLPILWAEQYPEGMGQTIPEVAELLSSLAPTPKLSFSCCGEKALLKQIHASRRRQFLLLGIECHVCIYQTTVDLLAEGYQVEVVADATASRTAENRTVGLERIRRAGGGITSVETALFELLRVAEGPKFKEILSLVK